MAIQGSGDPNPIIDPSLVQNTPIPSTISTSQISPMTEEQLGNGSYSESNYANPSLSLQGYAAQLYNGLGQLSGEKGAVIKQYLAPLLSLASEATTTDGGQNSTPVISLMDGSTETKNAALVANINAVLQQSGGMSTLSGAQLQKVKQNLYALYQQNLAVSPQQLTETMNTQLSALSSAGSGIQYSLRSLSALAGYFGSSVSSTLQNMSAYYEESSSGGNIVGTIAAAAAYQVGAFVNGRAQNSESVTIENPLSLLPQPPNTITVGQAQGVVSFFLATTISSSDSSSFQSFSSGLSLLSSELAKSASTPLTETQYTNFRNLINSYLEPLSGEGTETPSLTTSLSTLEAYMQAGTYSAGGMVAQDKSVASGVLYGVELAAKMAASQNSALYTPIQGAAGAFAQEVEDGSESSAVLGASLEQLNTNIANELQAGYNMGGSVSVSTILNNTVDTLSAVGNQTPPFNTLSLSTSQVTQYLTGVYNGLSGVLPSVFSLDPGVKATLLGAMGETDQSEATRVQTFMGGLQTLANLAETNNVTMPYNSVVRYASALEGPENTTSVPPAETWGVMQSLQSLITVPTTTTENSLFSSTKNLFSQINKGYVELLSGASTENPALRQLNNLVPIVAQNFEVTASTVVSQGGTTELTPIPNEYNLYDALSGYTQNSAISSTVLTNVLTQIQALSINSSVSTQLGNLINAVQGGENTTSALSALRSLRIPFTILVAVGQNCLKEASSQLTTNVDTAKGYAQFAIGLLNGENPSGFGDTLTGFHNSADSLEILLNGMTAGTPLSPDEESTFHNLSTVLYNDLSITLGMRGFYTTGIAD